MNNSKTRHSILPLMSRNWTEFSSKLSESHQQFVWDPFHKHWTEDPLVTKTFNTELNFTFDLQINLSDCPEGQFRPYPKPPHPNLTNWLHSPFQPQTFPAWELGLKISFYVIAMLMAIVGNTIVLLIVIRSKRMHVSTHYYIASLAVSDILVGSTCMWVHLGINITPDFPFGAAICGIFPFLQITSVTASVLCLTAIAMDRLLATVFPLKTRHSKQKFSLFIIPAIWIISISVAVPNILVRRLMVLEWKDRRQAWCEEQWPRYYKKGKYLIVSSCPLDKPEMRTYYTVQGILLYFFPILVMTVCYSIIARTLWKHKTPGEHVDSMLLHQRKAKQKVFRMLIIVFIAFVLCWTTQEVLILYFANFTEQYLENVGRSLNYAAIYLAYFNSAINPVLYAGLNETFRKGFKEAFKCQLFKKKIHPISNGKTKNGHTGSSPAILNGTSSRSFSSPTPNSSNTSTPILNAIIKKGTTNGLVKQTQLSTIKEETKHDVKKSMNENTN